MKTISVKLEDRQWRLLEKASKATGMPTSALIRQGIDLVLERLSADAMSPAFRREVSTLLHEDRVLLKRLARGE
jgi:hypothetical protein